jgi:hypothetical protein
MVVPGSDNKAREVLKMATGSIFKEVRIRDKRHLHALIRAFERSRSAKTKDVVLSRPASDMTKEQMQEIFGRK